MKGVLVVVHIADALTITVCTLNPKDWRFGGIADI